MAKQIFVKDFKEVTAEEGNKMNLTQLCSQLGGVAIGSAAGLFLSSQFVENGLISKISMATTGVAGVAGVAHAAKTFLDVKTAIQEAEAAVAADGEVLGAAILELDRGITRSLLKRTLAPALIISAIPGIAVAYEKGMDFFNNRAGVSSEAVAAELPEVQEI